MPSKVVCFWLEPGATAEVYYRRYHPSDDSEKCTAKRVPYPGHAPVVWGYHDESVAIKTHPRSHDDASHDATPEERADPQWPKKCDCGYVFVDTDQWRVHVETLYLRVGTNELYTLSNAPAGAMYDAHWYRPHGAKTTPDGKNIVLKTPEGDWHIDGVSSNGPGWTRTGEPPNITCNPSIGIGNPQRMHGWLRNGILEIDSP